MKRYALIVAAFFAFAVSIMAQGGGGYVSMSGMIRKICREVKAERRHGVAAKSAYRGRSVCALVKVSDGGRASLEENGARIIDSIGDILIADIPCRTLPEVVNARGIRRVEAEMGRHLTLDTMATVTNACKVYAAEELPQAFRGEGVVMGIMDVGFDLTHPNFYDSSLTVTRIGAFWDQVTAQTSGDTLYVGREFTSPETIIGQAHSADAFLIEHGTHTLGIAAGTGAGSDFVGMAPESSICLVSNAVTDDLALIPDSLQYRYTFATDVLGFKYIFDYAARQGKPCVISFSEGSAMDFRGYDVLFGEALSALVGEGRIIVASAGNAGTYLSCLPKPEGKENAGAYMRSNHSEWTLTLTVRGDVSLRFIAHDDNSTTALVPISSVTEAEDSTLTVEMKSAAHNYEITFEAYPQCYDGSQTAIDITIRSANGIGSGERLSVELLGKEAEATLYSPDGGLLVDASNDRFDDATTGYNVNSPSSLPCVISVGATSWRTGWTDIEGNWHTLGYGQGGERSSYSSLGPTFDGRVKPDVMAPGSNIISSGSSFFMQSDDYEAGYTVSKTELGDRTYPWVVMTGTSMSSPAVGGIIALWLQACPLLSPADVMGIIQKTSERIGTATEQSDNACGYGAIDAYAGLLMALGLDGIGELPQRHLQGVVITPSGGQDVGISLSAPLEQAAEIIVYSIGGQKLKQQRMEAGESQATINLPHASGGVYALALRSADRKMAGSTLIRL